MKRFLFLGLAAMMLAWSSTSRAEVIMTVSQVGGDVVTTASGTLDTTDLSYGGHLTGGAEVDAQAAILLDGTVSNPGFYLYSGLSGPSSFGTGGTFYPSSGSGDLFGVIGNYGTLVTPNNYVSGATLSAADTFTNTTIDGLGLTAGTYTYTWGTGAHADSLVLNVNAPSVVPEPGSMTLVLSAAVIGLGLKLRSRRRMA